ncbi:hypothetical protein ABK040_011924 [Willaertia magna]
MINNQEQKDYQFPSSKLSLPKDENQEECIVLVACGSFNPITVLHVRMFETAKDYLQIEKKKEVIGGFISPVHQDYEKKKPTLISSNHRLNMSKLSIKDNDWIEVDDWEIKQKEYSRTLYVLQHFENNIKLYLNNNNILNKKIRIMLLCGTDLLESFIKPGVWIPEQVEHILSHYGVCCIERSGSVKLNDLIFENDVLYKYRNNINCIPEWIVNDVSSTKVRNLIKRGYSIKYYVNDNVLNYINENNLYK